MWTSYTRCTAWFLPAKSCPQRWYNLLTAWQHQLMNHWHLTPSTLILSTPLTQLTNNHYILPSKLKSQFGINGMLLKCIVNCLKDMKQRVVIGGKWIMLEASKFLVSPRFNSWAPIICTVHKWYVQECQYRNQYCAVYWWHKFGGRPCLTLTISDSNVILMPYWNGPMSTK